VQIFTCRIVIVESLLFALFVQVTSSVLHLLMTGCVSKFLSDILNNKNNFMQTKL